MNTNKCLAQCLVYFKSLINIKSSCYFHFYLSLGVFLLDARCRVDFQSHPETLRLVIKEFNYKICAFFLKKAF